MDNVFTRITNVLVPRDPRAFPDGFLPLTKIEIHADGEIPFPQLVVRSGDGRELLVVRDGDIDNAAYGVYIATLPFGTLPPGDYRLQAEGCKREDYQNAAPGDWVKYYADFTIAPYLHAEPKREEPAPPPAARPDDRSGAKLFFGIHKHMHQPYYRAAEPSFWDGQCDEIFATRAGAYRRYINMAAEQYQALPHAGLSMSWSGSLVEQLDRASAEGLARGAYAGDWKAELIRAANLQTASGRSRAEFSAFGFFHPLMPLVPGRNIKAQISMHRDMVRREFGAEASAYLFPPETAFHVRMLPALIEAGVKGVLYDSIHRYRSCRDYPYAGREEGMLPPNASEQENPPVNDWLQLNNVWAGSKISPSLLKPEYVKYRDADGEECRILAIPAERYIGNEDARGGFGALVYPDVLGQVLDALVRGGNHDPAHPPFFLLHSDGDNYGGGADSYYGSNTGAMVEWLKRDPRFELTGIEDYLDRFPPDPGKAVHLEPGSWSGADNGDPQFMKWFSGYNTPYSPDLNSWAVLTALQNAVHTMLDLHPDDRAAREAERLMLTAEASDYWYWTGQDIWDGQVTAAANQAMELLRDGLDAVAASRSDTTGPTIFPPWVTPENPGGKTWGANGLVDADRAGVAHTFIHDVSGIRSARLFARFDAGNGEKREIPLRNRGPYPSRTGAAVSASLFEAELPVGAGDIRYWIEAEDNRGNTARSALERIFLA